jgi:hypothetical protein
MAKIRNVSGEDLVVPWLGHRVVKADETVDVPDKDYDAYVCQPDTWEGVGEPKTAPKAPASKPRSGKED